MATWIIGILLALVVCMIVLKMIKDRRSGKGGCSCGGGCSGCHGCCSETADADKKAH